MPIARNGEFLVMNDFAVAPSLGIESGNIEGCVAEVNRLGIKSIFACSAYGFREDNLDFLVQMPQLTQIWFWEVSLKHVAGIYALTDLRFFNLHNRTMGIDFSRLSRLKHVIWHHNAKDTNLDQLPEIEQLDLWRFNPKVKTFEDCTIPDRLKRLEINWANPATLDGLPVLPKCQELQLHYCRNLRTLEGIERIAPNLQRLVITASNKCKETSAVSRLTKLNHVFINKPTENA